MATAKPIALPSHQLSRRRRGGQLFALLLLVAVALGIYYWQSLRGNAVLGASYGARMGCSCRFIGGRSLSDCRKDLEPGMELVTLSEDADAKSVTARFPLVASQTATYREGEGCVLEKWDN